MGYRKAKAKTDNGHDFYLKRRLTRAGGSRCTIQVEFVTNGYVHVQSIERFIKPGSPTGMDESRGLHTVRDLRGWERFAFCF